MTKKEYREIHAHPDTYYAMTQYYFSYQMDLYNLCIYYMLHTYSSWTSEAIFTLNLDSSKRCIC